jgi:hypothetical protein
MIKPESAAKKRYRMKAAHPLYRAWTSDIELVQAAIEHKRKAGASLESLAESAGVGLTTIQEIVAGRRPKIRQETADLLLAPTPVKEGKRSIPANGTRWRLRGLTAMGHASGQLAADLSEITGRPVLQESLNVLLRDADKNGAKVVSPDLRDAVKQVYAAKWNKRPDESALTRHRTAQMARARAQREGWPQPMALDDDRIDRPDYAPKYNQPWMPAEGTGTVNKRGSDMQTTPEQEKQFDKAHDAVMKETDRTQRAILNGTAAMGHDASTRHLRAIGSGTERLRELVAREDDFMRAKQSARELPQREAAG